VKQVTERARPVAEVAKALGVSNHSLYVWLKQYGKPAEQQQEESVLQAEICRLKAELRQVTEERNILKEAAAYFASESRKGTRVVVN
jgi:transposase